MSLELDRVFESADSRFKVVLNSGVISRMLKECRRVGGRETGGILAGKYSADFSTAVATHVTGPPSDTKHGRSWLIRGIKGLAEWLSSLWEQNLAYYLGEWHFHPGADPNPSPVDSKQLSEIATAARYNCKEPILVIVGGNTEGKWHLSVTVFERGRSHFSLYEREYSHERTS